MIPLKRLAAAAILATAACATGPGLQSRMAAFIGASPAALVQDLGVPDKQITVGGVQYIAYVRRDQQISPGIGYGGFYGGGPFWGGGFGGPFGGFYGGGFYGGGFPAQIYTYSCETTFAVVNGKVASFTLRGNDCS